MDKAILLLQTLLLLSFLCSACSGTKEEEAFRTVESLRREAPVRALEIVDSILLDEGKLSDKYFADFCLEGCLLRDSLTKPFYPDKVLRRAVDYFHKKSQENREMLLLYYSGRSYAGQEKSEEAVKAYLKALSLADRLDESNRAGYICSYLADLYKSDLTAEPARNYYARAENYFGRAGNARQRIIAVRDQGDTYTIGEECEKAIAYYLRADSLLDAIPEDSVVRSSIANHLGIVYQMMEDFPRARTFFEKSIRYDPQNLSAGFSLSNISIDLGNIRLAKEQLASTLGQLSDPEDRMILYNRLSELEDKTGNYRSALENLRQSDRLLDSITKHKYTRQLYEIEQKYNKDQVLIANMRLSLQRNQVILLTCIFFFLTVFSVLFYQKEINRRKRKALELQKITEKQQFELREQQLVNERNAIELQAKEKTIAQIRRFAEIMKASLFKDSVLYRKIKLVSHLPLQERKKQSEYEKAIGKIFGGPTLSDADKSNLKEITNELYPSFTEKLHRNIPTLSDEEELFCYLLMFGLSIGDLAIILNKTVNTIKSKRYRIMTKAGLTNQHMKIEDYLKRLAEDESGVTDASNTACIPDK